MTTRRPFESVARTTSWSAALAGINGIAANIRMTRVKKRARASRIEFRQTIGTLSEARHECGLRREKVKKNPFNVKVYAGKSRTSNGSGRKPVRPQRALRPQVLGKFNIRVLAADCKMKKLVRDNHHSFHQLEQSHAARSGARLRRGRQNPALADLRASGRAIRDWFDHAAYRPSHAGRRMGG